MAGWDLKSGSITEYEVSEDRIWSLFNYVFSDSSRKRYYYSWDRFLEQVNDDKASIRGMQS